MNLSPTTSPAAGTARKPLLRDLDDLHRRLVEGVSDYAIYMLDPEGHVSSWNLGAQRFKGYRADEIIGRHFSTFYTEEDRAAQRPALALRTSMLEGRFEDRAWRVRKDGTRFRAHVIIDPIRDDDGTLLGFAKITRDISDSYAQEMALRASEQRFRLLVSGVTDYAIYMLDLDGHITSWNAGAERFKGYKEPEVLGRHFSMFYTEDDRRDGRPALALHRARTEGRFEGMGWRLRKDGTPFWAHVFIDLIHDEGGTPIGFAKITRDVTERRAAELRLRELTSSNQELEQFIHIASHDMREPLRKVLAFSDLLLQEEGQQLTEAARGYLGSITAATRRMQALLASLLDLTRVTSQGRSFEPCALGEALREVCSDLQMMIGEKGATVHAGALPTVEADGAQMRQLFQNLIENAIKYAREGVPPVIEIAEQPDDDPERITLVCQDNGIGFEPQYAERIFGVFQRLHARDRYGGAGIGLSICRKICVRHGGSIRAEGRPGEGATFIVRLPRRHRADSL
ncbi:MAG: PAS domain-containing sensor histidine kinase [Nevskiaceae bacterium]|nr:MAG: PAS domain-containing sensor histidine kinase [Nevskiaceae bacterium]